MVTLHGSLDMLLLDQRLDSNFRKICRLITTKLGNDPYFEGRTPQKLAYVIVSAIINRYSKDHLMSVSKKDLRKKLGLSPTAAEYTPWGGKDDWANFRQRIFKIYDDMKSGKYDRNIEVHEPSID